MKSAAGNHAGLRAAAVAGVMLWLMAAPLSFATGDEPTVDELKARIANASIADRPPLCIHVCERQVDMASRFYVAGDSDKAQAALTDVAAFAELARDYAIQSHKHEKQCEIAVRKMVRKLTDLEHAVSHEDEGTVKSTVERLERVRDDLLAAMFSKGNKK